MVGFMRAGRWVEPSPYDKGFRAGYRGSDCSVLDWFAPSQDYLAWYQGWKAGRAAAELDAVKRVAVGREWARNYLGNSRRA